MFSQVNNVLGVDIGSFKIIVSKNKESLQIFNGEREVRSIMGFQESGVRIFFQENLIKKSMVENIILSPFLLQLNQHQNLFDLWVYFGNQISIQQQDKQYQQQQQQQQLINLRGENYSKFQIYIMYLTQIYKTIQNYIQQSQSSNQNILIFLIPSYLNYVQKQTYILALQTINKNNFYSIISDQKALAQIYFEKFIKQKIQLLQQDQQQQQNQNDQQQMQIQNVMFIDLGYIYTTISVIQFVFNNKICQTTIQHNKSKKLGIQDLDKQFMKFLLSKLEDLNQEKINNYLNNTKIICKLYEVIEKTRKVLSANNECQINIENILQDQDLFFILTRSQYQDCISLITEKYSEFLFEQLCIVNQIQIKLDKIEIIGGGARIPILNEVISNLVQNNELIHKSFHSTETLSLGASVQINLSKNFTQFFVQRQLISPIFIHISFQGFNDFQSRQTIQLIQQNVNLPIQNQFQIQLDPLHSQVFIQIDYQNELINEFQISYSFNNQNYLQLNFSIDEDLNMKISHDHLQQQTILQNSIYCQFLINDQNIKELNQIENDLQQRDVNFDKCCNVFNDMEALYYKFNKQISSMEFKTYFHSIQVKMAHKNMENIVNKFQNWQQQKIFDYQQLLDNYQSSIQDYNKVNQPDILLVNQIKDINLINSKQYNIIKLDLNNKQIATGGGLNKYIWPGGFEIAKAIAKIQNKTLFAFEIDLRNNLLNESTEEIINTILNKVNICQLLLRFNNINVQQIDKLIFGLIKMPNLKHLVLDLKINEQNQYNLQKAVNTINKCRQDIQIDILE